MKIGWEGYSKRDVFLYNESVSQDILEKRQERLQELQAQQQKKAVEKAPKVGADKQGRIDIYV